MSTKHVRGITVEIEGAGGKEVDTAWESVSLGETDEDGGPYRVKVRFPWLELSGDSGWARISTWVTEAGAGKQQPRTVSVTPTFEDGSIGDTWVFHDCWIIRYVPPRLVRPDPNDPCPPGPPKEELRIGYKELVIR